MPRKVSFTMKGALILALCLALTCGTAFAAYQSYSITLPRLSGHQTLVNGEKATNDDYVLNRVIAMGAGYEEVICWVDKNTGGSSWTPISDDYSCYEGNTTRISFRTNENAGTYIRLRGKNGTFSTVNVNVSGEAALR